MIALDAEGEINLMSVYECYELYEIIGRRGVSTQTEPAVQ